MIRVGIVGTNTSHASAYAGLLNGIDGNAPVVAGARVTAVWSSGKEPLAGVHPDAPELARTFGIPEVVTELDDMAGAVDLVLVLDNFKGGALHPELARPFIEAGTPTYVDKPIALEIAQAVELFDIAKHTGAPLMSCSALRFADEIATLQSGLDNLSTIVSVGPGDWYNYGIHAVEAAVLISGVGAQSVLQIHSPKRDLTIINHQDGPRILVGTLRDAKPPFHVTLYGSEGIAQAEISNYQGFYANTMRAAVRMAETGTSPVDRNSSLEVLAILAAGQRSAATGAAVQIADVLAEPV